MCYSPFYGMLLPASEEQTGVSDKETDRQGASLGCCNRSTCSTEERKKTWTTWHTKLQHFCNSPHPCLGLSVAWENLKKGSRSEKVTEIRTEGGREARKAVSLLASSATAFHCCWSPHLGGPRMTWTIVTQEVFVWNRRAGRGWQCECFPDICVMGSTAN